jgi:hypothetical protein
VLLWVTWEEHGDRLVREHNAALTGGTEEEPP